MQSIKAVTQGSITNDDAKHGLKIQERYYNKKLSFKYEF